MSRPELIVITGPTATGKTGLGVRLAKLIDGEIVSADSMQIYKHMNIGTAKPAADEMLGVPHHMLDVVPPWEDYSVARYVEDASECIDDIYRRNRQPILVGGTGLYIDSLLAGRGFSAKGSAGLRKTLEAQYDSLGGEAMLQQLFELDPVSAAKLHVNDKKRIIRALEICITTGKTISQHDSDSKSLPPRYNAVKFALMFSDRAALYMRIDSRVDVMMLKGLEGEVRSLLETGVPPDCTAMQAIGYKELLSAFSGSFSIDDAVEKIKMESRRFAKRQLTWLRRDHEVRWITWENAPDLDRGVEEIVKHYTGQ